MNYRRLLELFWEFDAKIEALHALYLDSLAGYSILHERVLANQQRVRELLGDHEYGTPQFQDTCGTLYSELCNRDFSSEAMSPYSKQGDVKARVKDDGKNVLLLGHMCVVSAYSYWEEYLRIEIGKAMGVLPQDARNNDATRETLNKHVVSDFWGDIRHLRNFIVHNNGIANSDAAKLKLLNWFKPEQSVDLDYEKMRQIFIQMALYRNELHAMSLPVREVIEVDEKGRLKIVQLATPEPRS